MSHMYRRCKTTLHFKNYITFYYGNTYERLRLMRSERGRNKMRYIHQWKVAIVCLVICMYVCIYVPPSSSIVAGCNHWKGMEEKLKLIIMKFTSVLLTRQKEGGHLPPPYTAF